MLSVHLKLTFKKEICPKGCPLFEMIRSDSSFVLQWFFPRTFFPKEDLYLLSTFMNSAKEKSQTEFYLLQFYNADLWFVSICTARLGFIGRVMPCGVKMWALTLKKWVRVYINICTMFWLTFRCFSFFLVSVSVTLFLHTCLFSCVCLNLCVLSDGSLGAKSEQHNFFPSGERAKDWAERQQAGEWDTCVTQCHHTRLKHHLKPQLNWQLNSIKELR